MNYSAIVAYVILLFITAPWIAVALKTRKGTVTRGETMRMALAAGAETLIGRLLIQWEAVASVWLWAIPTLAAVWAAAEIGTRWHLLSAGTRPGRWKTLESACYAGLIVALTAMLAWQTWFR